MSERIWRKRECAERGRARKGVSPSSSSRGSDSATLRAADVTMRAALAAGALRTATALPLNDFFCRATCSERCQEDAV